MNVQHTIFLCLSFCLITGAVLAAENAWKVYRSDTTLLSVRMPAEPKEASTAFRIAPGRVAHSLEMTATIDQRPYKKAVKNYIVKINQSLAPGFSEASKLAILNREVAFYEEYYKSQGGSVRNKEIFTTKKGSGALLEMNYSIEGYAPQGFKAEMHLDHFGLTQQMVTGPEAILNAFKTRDYFETSTFKKNHIARKGSFAEDWADFESPLGLFSVKVPPITPPYFTKAPYAKATDDDRDVVSLVFNDPVWRHQLFYNIHSYGFDVKLSNEAAQTVLIERHIKKHRGDTQGVLFKRANLDGGISVIDTHYPIKAPKGYPYLSKARLRVMFAGNFMIVQEMMGTDHMIDSNFAKSVFELVEFKPRG